MGERTTKNALFAEFAAVGKVLANPTRLELLDLLAQGPRSVECLATAADVGVNTCSAHLQTLKGQAWSTPAETANGSTTPSPATTSPPCGTSCGAWPNDTAFTPSSPDAPTSAPRTPPPSPPKSSAAASGSVTPSSSTSAPAPSTPPDTSPAALHIPVEELADRLAELPTGRDIVAYCRGQYCVLAHDAVRLLTAHGLPAQRAVDGVLEWRLAGLPFERGAA